MLSAWPLLLGLRLIILMQKNRRAARITTPAREPMTMPAIAPPLRWLPPLETGAEECVGVAVATGAVKVTVISGSLTP